MAEAEDQLPEDQLPGVDRSPPSTFAELQAVLRTEDGSDRLGLVGDSDIWMTVMAGQGREQKLQVVLERVGGDFGKALAAVTASREGFMGDWNQPELPVQVGMILVLLATGGEHYLPAAQQAIKGLREKIGKQRKIYGNAAVECETLLAILARIKPPNE